MRTPGRACANSRTHLAGALLAEQAGAVGVRAGEEQGAPHLFQQLLEGGVEAVPDVVANAVRREILRTEVRREQHGAQIGDDVVEHVARGQSLPRMAARLRVAGVGLGRRQRLDHFGELG